MTPMKTPNPIEEKIEEFEENFTYQNSDREIIVRYTMCQNPKELAEDIKSFLLSSLLQVRASVLSEIEVKMPKDSKEWREGSEAQNAKYFSNGYNQALQEIKSLLEEMKK